MSEIPVAIGPYRIQGLLGRGGMGVVYRAAHARLGTPAAVKTVRLRRADELQDIRREIHALARLAHPGIVRIVDEGVDAGAPWYAMELLPERTLADRLRELWPVAAASWSREDQLAETVAIHAGVEPPAPAEERPIGLTGDARSGPVASAGNGALSEVLELLEALADALDYLHAEGFVHRDLKPGNVALRRSGAPVLLDFGLAAMLASHRRREVLDVATARAGTAAYVAPEQILGRVVDARADLYSLGCIAHELCCGSPPFGAGSGAALLAHHVSSAPPPLSSLVDALPDELESLVMRLLEKEPRDRPGYAGEVAATFRRLRGVAPEVAPPPRRGYLYRPSLGGRGDELARLDRRLARLREGEGGIVCLVGESGIGKTRLAMELCARARDLGHAVLDGECPPPLQRDSGAALAALRRPLQQIADHCLEHGVAETARILGARTSVLARYAPALALVPGAETDAEVAELPAAAARARTLDYLHATLAAYVAARPALLVVDDLQWADDLTAGFLEKLCRGGVLARVPLLVVATCRAEELGAAVPLLQEEVVERVDVGRLDEEAIGAIVRDMLALSSAPRALVAHLASRAEGSPFFAAEYLQFVVERGLVFRSADRGWSVALEGVEEALPLHRSLRELVKSRLSGLSGDASRVVAAAAVLGREVRLELLAELAGIDETELLDALEELRRRHVLDDEAVGGAARFAHDKIRETAYEALPAPDRRRLHGLAAAMLARAASDPSEALARHWERAGDPARAAACYLEVAREATARSAFADAVRASREARRLGGGVETGLAAAEALAGLARFDEAMEEARGVSGSPDASAEERARAWILEAEVQDRCGAAREALALADRAIASGCSEPLALRALVRKGIGFWRLGHLEDALSVLADACAEARRQGASRLLGDALNATGIVHLDRADRAEAARALEAALAIRREAGDRHGAAHTLNGLGILAHDLGDYPRAHAAFEESLRIRRAIGDRHGIAQALNNLGMVLTAQGRHAEALAASGESLQLRRELGDRYGETNTLLDRALLHVARGEAGEARSELEAAMAQAEAREMRYQVATGLLVRARLALSVDPASARCDVDRALGLWRDLGNAASEAIALSLSARLDAAGGRTAEAREAIARGRACAERAGEFTASVQVLEDEGWVLLQLGDREAAQEVARRGAAMTAARGAVTAGRRFDALLLAARGATAC